MANIDPKPVWTNLLDKSTNSADKSFKDFKDLLDKISGKKVSETISRPHIDNTSILPKRKTTHVNELVFTNNSRKSNTSNLIFAHSFDRNDEELMFTNRLNKEEELHFINPMRHGNNKQQSYDRHQDIKNNFYQPPY